MKTRILIATLLLMTVALILITAARATAQNSNEFVVPLGDPGKRGKLKAHINYGSIMVKGTARKDVLVRYASESDDDDDEARQSKDGMRRIGGGGMDLEITETDNQVKVQSDSWSNKLNLEIEVPAGMDLDVHTYNDGDLMVSNIQGELELTNYNGEITALNISGSVVATTYNGEVKVTFDKVTDNTPMSFTTYNGDIDVSFPGTFKGTLKLKTEQGSIYSNFDIKFQSTGPVQKKDVKSGVYKVVIDEWKRADVNGGGAEITMRNYNGDINVRKK